MCEKNNKKTATNDQVCAPLARAYNNDQILVVGAQEHNLKNITVAIPKNKLTVITGPSGSGKSSLAFDVLFAEGQRRYLESMSLYVRQFVGMPQKARCERIDGLCPAIAIDQKTVGANPRSTVGTITEVADYLRILFARVGRLHCPDCNVPVAASTISMIIDTVMQRFLGKTVEIRTPCAHQKKGTFVQDVTALVTQGVYRFVIDGEQLSFYNATDVERLQLGKTTRHTVDGVIDSVVVSAQGSARLSEAIERACTLGNGQCKIVVDGVEHLHSLHRSCASCGQAFAELEPRMFSFNSPEGACKTCEGLGVVYFSSHEMYCEAYGWSNGMRSSVCSSCKGKRLAPLALSVYIDGKNIFEVANMAIGDAIGFFSLPIFTAQELVIAGGLRDEIISRLQFLKNVGLGYLSLNRDARTLSGGEGQRIRLARQLGTALSGILYILDEPSIGLHQRDNDRLIETLKGLRDMGNTVVVVEHDHDTMINADYLIDMGKGAGIHGGTIVAQGTPDQVAQAHAHSLTGAFLSGARSINRLTEIRRPEKFFTLSNVTVNNIKDLSIDFPIGVLCCVSGVSGSGKSSLIMDALVPAFLSTQSGYSRWRSQGACLQKVTEIDTMVVIDQSPIGRTPRSNPATYIGIFNDIRALFAGLPESKARAYGPGRFSFNVAAGRCAQCRGDGSITVSMHLIPDVITACPSCKGARFNKQTLEVKLKDKSISDILAMTAAEAVEFFAYHKGIHKRLALLCEVGLDYLTLGQPSTTLSGGEAQRIKLVNELAKRGQKTVYVLDEPTTGLHAADVEKLLYVFHRLIEQGNTVIVIEHNIDVLKVADYIIDLGPEGGDNGGKIVAAGTPEVIAQCAESHTGRYLKKVL